VSLPLIASATARQERERTIKKYNWGNEPVKIAKVKVKGMAVGLDQKFVAEDD
jgi:hypothetical protein